MIFIILTFLAAFLIEGLGTAVSVIGLSTLFGANTIIIALAIALDLGKLVVVSLVYKHWSSLNKLMRAYAMIAAVVTMTITSAGAAGYLSQEFQQAIIGTQEGSMKVDVLKQQLSKYEDRKKQIDAQIAALPEKTSVSQRLRLMNGFKAEQSDLEAKISKLDADLPDLQIKQISTEAHAGPILYIAKAFDVPVEVAVKYVILMIIFVFDPLAVFLIIAANFLIEQRRIKIESTPVLQRYGTDKSPDVFSTAVEPEKAYTPPETTPARNFLRRAANFMKPQSEPVLIQTTAGAPTYSEAVAEVHALADKIRAAVPEEVPPPPAEPEVPPDEYEGEVLPAREEITLDQLRPPHATLADAPVTADGTVSFEETPEAKALSTYIAKFKNPK